VLCSSTCQEEPAPPEEEEAAAPQEMSTEEALKTIVTSLRNLKELERKNKLEEHENFNTPSPGSTAQSTWFLPGTSPR